MSCHNTKNTHKMFSTFKIDSNRHFYLIAYCSTELVTLELELKQPKHKSMKTQTTWSVLTFKP